MKIRWHPSWFYAWAREVEQGTITNPKDLAQALRDVGRALEEQAAAPLRNGEVLVDAVAKPNAEMFKEVPEWKPLSSG